MTKLSQMTRNKISNLWANKLKSRICFICFLLIPVIQFIDLNYVELTCNNFSFPRPLRHLLRALSGRQQCQEDGRELHLVRLSDLVLSVHWHLHVETEGQGKVRHRRINWKRLSVQLLLRRLRQLPSGQWNGSSVLNMSKIIVSIKAYYKYDVCFHSYKANCTFSMQTKVFSYFDHFFYFDICTYLEPFQCLIRQTKIQKRPKI